MLQNWTEHEAPRDEQSECGAGGEIQPPARDRGLGGEARLIGRLAQDGLRWLRRAANQERVCAAGAVAINGRHRPPRHRVQPVGRVLVYGDEQRARILRRNPAVASIDALARGVQDPYPSESVLEWLAECQP